MSDDRLSPQLDFGSATAFDVFRDIRNYLAGRLVGATRDHSLMREVLRCLFVRTHLAWSGELSGPVADDGLATAAIYRSEFARLRVRLNQVFEETEEILLDPEALAFVDRKLAKLDLRNPERDPIGDAYEAFAGSELRSREGQFFTPQNAISWLVEAIDPKEGERIVDPACGAGGFLAISAKHLIRNGTKPEAICEFLHGIEKDKYLTTLAHAHLALITLSSANVVCGDSLSLTDIDGQPIASTHEAFDVVLANPPFGAKIISASDEVRSGFQLAYKWKIDKRSSSLQRTSELTRSSPPQVLFVERIINMTKPGGRIGIVLPESVVSNKSYAPVVKYILSHTTVRAVIGMPESLFKTSGKGGTHTKTCLLVLTKKIDTHESTSPIYFAEARWCGHDSRGSKTERDDLPTILEEFQNGADADTQLGYWLEPNEISCNILAPRYYDPTAAKMLAAFKDTHDCIRVSELVEQGLLEIRSGDEIGKAAYGTGSIPFVRTSDISNWEIKIDPKHGVSEAIFQRLARKQDVKAGDILMVRDGTYLIGTSAIVTKYDEKILYQSHLLKIRSLDRERLSPHLLLALLSSEPVLAQIKSKRFTQDIIDTLGDRLLEIVLPMPRDKGHRDLIISSVERAVRERIEARELSRRARAGVMDIDFLSGTQENSIIVGDVLN